MLQALADAERARIPYSSACKQLCNVMFCPSKALLLEVAVSEAMQQSKTKLISLSTSCDKAKCGSIYKIAWIASINKIKSLPAMIDCRGVNTVSEQPATGE